MTHLKLFEEWKNPFRKKDGDDEKYLIKYKVIITENGKEEKDEYTIDAKSKKDAEIKFQNLWEYDVDNIEILDITKL